MQPGQQDPAFAVLPNGDHGTFMGRDILWDEQVA